MFPLKRLYLYINGRADKNPFPRTSVYFVVYASRKTIRKDYPATRSRIRIGPTVVLIGQGRKTTSPFREKTRCV